MTHTPHPTPTTLPLTVEAGVATVTLASKAPQQALLFETLQTMLEVAQHIRGRTDIHAVVLTGSPTRFSAGVDLSLLAALDQASLLERRQLVRLGPDMCDAWAAIEVPTIAAIEGPCVGGGLALALSCDFRVVSDSAQLRLPEVPLGMSMSWHSLPKLVALVGPAKAKRVALAGELVDAATALAWGLAERQVAAGQSLSNALAWAHDLAALPPIAVRMTKETINALAHALAPLATHMDRDQFLLSQSSEDLAEGIQAWLQKRPPHFQGR